MPDEGSPPQGARARQALLQFVRRRRTAATPPPAEESGHRNPLRAFSEQKSLFGEILDWMLAPLLLLWPMSVGLTWLVAQGIANRPYDRDLSELARTIAQRVVVEEGASRTLRAPEPLAETVADLLRSDDTG